MSPIKFSLCIKMCLYVRNIAHIFDNVSNWDLEMFKLKEKSKHTLNNRQLQLQI